MKRLILTIILGILIISLTGCVSYRHHHPWQSRSVVVVTGPKHPPLPPAQPRQPHRHHTPPPKPRRNQRF